MAQRNVATTRFTMLPGVDSLCTVTWKQNLGRPGHLSCLGASKTSCSRTLGTFQMSKIKVKLCDHRCYGTPSPFYAYLTSQCYSQTRIEEKTVRLRILLRSFFFFSENVSHLFNNCIKKQKREGKNKTGIATCMLANGVIKIL